MSTLDFGLIGLAVMGQNLVLNIANNGFKVAVYNRTNAVTQEFVDANPDKGITGFNTLAEFVASIARPRKIMIMVKAGAPVDAVIEQLLPLLEEGDLVIDGGNSLYSDTQRRYDALTPKGILYLGSGVSGGEEGALKGPSIMPGGSKQGWELVAPIFNAISAKAQGEACCRYMGAGGAGHYVKMVHNGIEYGDMQLICEAYDILKRLGGFSSEELEQVFTSWNQGELESYLIQITSKIFSIKDENGEALVEKILDKAGQKGTGKWTVISATENNTVASTINAAVEARIISSWIGARKNASQSLSGIKPQVLASEELAKYGLDRQSLVNAVRDALFASKIVSYAQGLDLLSRASEENNWNLNLGDIAAIWRGGCIIRARFLNDITAAYTSNAELQNLMLAPYFQQQLQRTQQGWRQIIALAVSNGLPVPAFSASLGYYDSYRSPRLPANLLQAQRDYFGAHTYERTDKEGVYHTQWPEVID